MLHADANLGDGDALVAPLLAFRQRLTCLALALDVHPPALRAPALLALAADVALVGIDVAAGGRPAASARAR